MKQGIRKTITGTLILLTMLGGGAALAQDRDRDRTRDPATDRDRVTDRDRIQDRDQDRIADRDRLLDRDRDRLQDRDQDRLQDRDQDRLQDRDQLQDRDRLHVQDREQLRDRDIFGSELMTRQERREYRNRIQEMQTVQEWARFRAEHQTQMTARAREQSVELPAPFYGQQLTTDQERERLRERLQAAISEQERQRIRAEHREEMQERARLHQIPLSELEE